MRGFWIPMVCCCLAFLMGMYTMYGVEPKTVTKELIFPHKAGHKIINVEGYDYQVAWWLWGPHSIEEQQAEHNISPVILRQLIKRETCK